MRKLSIVFILCALFATTNSNAQHRRQARRVKTQRTITRTSAYHDNRILPVPPPNQPDMRMEVPREKGRTVMQEQVSNSGSIIATPVPPPRKVVISPAPPPPGNTGTMIPRKR